MNELQHAAFWVEWGPNDFETIDVQFNPTELAFTKAAQFAEIAIPGLDAPVQQFVRGQAEKLTVELFFDTTDGGAGAAATSVTTLTDRFYQLVKIDARTHAPPVCEFHWNAAHFPGVGERGMGAGYANQRRNAFRCVVESVAQKFTLFSPQGVPLRATLSLALREYKTLAEQLVQLNLQSPDHTRAYVVRAGDTLPGVAAAVYGRPAEWRALAEANGIADPRRLAPGRTLTVPPL
ncbi:MAG TPA: LysM peptidoglycan-binding domain-containing protein [Urbifossiella sp.]|nr:LysM peptidoglycan-binding domain-containing protein [Urbifossiella sp.]